MQPAQYTGVHLVFVVLCSGKYVNPQPFVHEHANEQGEHYNASFSHMTPGCELTQNVFM